jgi:hypothetical protein
LDCSFSIISPFPSSSITASAGGDDDDVQVAYTSLTSAIPPSIIIHTPHTRVKVRLAVANPLQFSIKSYTLLFNNALSSVFLSRIFGFFLDV